MVNVIRLYPDMSFEEKKRKTEQDKILLSKDYHPKFKLGLSVFRERPKSFLIRLLMFWKHPRNLMIICDGAPYVMSFDQAIIEGQIKPALAFNFGTMKETQEFVAKIVAKSKAEQKPISNTQFMILAILNVVGIALILMVARGQKIV